MTKSWKLSSKIVETLNILPNFPKSRTIPTPLKREGRKFKTFPHSTQPFLLGANFRKLSFNFKQCIVKVEKEKKN